MANKKVTMDDIALELGVSKSLVSKALSDAQGINEETKERVRYTANRLGYRFKKGVSLDSSGKTSNVAVLLPREDVGDFDYWGVILNGIEEEMSRNDYSVMFSGIDMQAEGFAALPISITERKVDGVIIMGQISKPIILATLSTGLPVVLIDSDYQDVNADIVYADNFGGGYEAARFLLANGHRELGFVGDLGYSLTFRERFRGFSAAIDHHRAETGQEVSKYEISGSRGNSIIPVSSDEMLECLQANNRPTALFCGNDPVAFVVLQLMDKLQMSCPDQISLIGFDNVSKCEMSITPLTSIEPHKRLMGERASQLLMRRIEYNNGVPERIQLAVETIVRKTIKKI